MKLENESIRKFAYLLLFAVQMFGSVFLVWKSLPAFKELVLNPGQQMLDTPYDSGAVVAVLLAMQAAYWYRLRRVTIPFRGRSIALSHIFLFLGRLNFIFGSASIVLFRHVPELDRADINILLMARRGIMLVASLFALFCFTLELESLAAVLGEAKRT